MWTLRLVVDAGVSAGLEGAGFLEEAVQGSV